MRLRIRLPGMQRCTCDRQSYAEQPRQNFLNTTILHSHLVERFLGPRPVKFPVGRRLPKVERTLQSKMTFALHASIFWHHRSFANVSTISHRCQGVWVGRGRESGRSKETKGVMGVFTMRIWSGFFTAAATFVQNDSRPHDATRCESWVKQRNCLDRKFKFDLFLVSGQSRH